MEGMEGEGKVYGGFGKVSKGVWMPYKGKGWWVWNRWENKDKEERVGSVGMKLIGMVVKLMDGLYILCVSFFSQSFSNFEVSTRFYSEKERVLL